MVHNSIVINARQNLTRSSSSSELSQETANGVAFGRNVCCNSDSNSSATVQSPFVLNTSNFQQTNTITSDTTSTENFSDNHFKSPEMQEMQEMIRQKMKDQLQNTLSGQDFTRIKSLNPRAEDDTHQEAIDKVKSSCDDVVINKHNEISSRKITNKIVKYFAIASSLTAVAAILFIILAKPTLLILVASIIILTTAITAFLISTLCIIAVRSDTDKDNCHAFIANMLKDMEFKSLEKQPKALNTLNNIITYYLNGSTPIELEPFTKLSSLNMTDLDKQTQDKNAQENARKVLDNFIEVLKFSVEADHKKAKKITPEFLESFKEDIAAYTETLTANKVMALANLPLRESEEKLQSKAEVLTHSEISVSLENTGNSETP